jgi:hypothetical protein
MELKKRWEISYWVLIREMSVRENDGKSRRRGELFKMDTTSGILCQCDGFGLFNECVVCTAEVTVRLAGIEEKQSPPLSWVRETNRTGQERPNTSGRLDKRACFVVNRDETD